jgi:uncharacterized membrane protein
MFAVAQEFGARFHQGGSLHPWFGLLFWLLFVALIGVAVWLFVRATHSVRGLPATGPSSDPAMDTLRARFAQGEIDGQEFAARAAHLSGRAAPTTSTPDEVGPSSGEALTESGES